MNHEANFWDSIKRIRAQDDRFDPEAYAFVMEALEFTIHSLGERRHISARELLGGVCAYARARYGPLAYEVVRSWGLGAPFEVGLVVFQLVEVGVLSRRDNDRLEDFNVELDLEEAITGRYFE